VSPEELTVLRRRWRIKACALAIAMATIAIALAIRSFFAWLAHPHIIVTVYNESSGDISNLRVAFPDGDRVAEYLAPGHTARAEIQFADEGIFFSYTDRGGIARSAEEVFDYMGNRGTLEYHVTNDGVRIVNGIYWFDEIPILGVYRVAPKGRMVVR
jgi:hypothetical protein